MAASFLNLASSFYQPLGQAVAATRIRSSYLGFVENPNAQTAWSLGGNVIGVIGTERVVGQLVKYGVKLAIKARGVDSRAGPEMVDLMKSRVPQDTGRLLNGITSEDDGDTITVTASAARDGDADYARYVEFGTKDNGAVADDDFFSSGADAGIPLRGRTRHHGATEAQPFFWNSAREVLSRYGKDLSEVIDQTANEEGMS